MQHDNSSRNVNLDASDRTTFTAEAQDDHAWTHLLNEVRVVLQDLVQLVRLHVALSFKRVIRHTNTTRMQYGREVRPPPVSVVAQPARLASARTGMSSHVRPVTPGLRLPDAEPDAAAVAALPLLSPVRRCTTMRSPSTMPTSEIYRTGHQHVGHRTAGASRSVTNMCSRVIASQKHRHLAVAQACRVLVQHLLCDGQV